MIYDFLSDSVNKETQSYLSASIVDSSCNPNTGNISKIIGQFDGHRNEEFNSNVKGCQEKVELNSLVQLRNDLAHGRSNNPSINTVIRYYKSGVKILDILYTVLYPHEI